MTFQLPQEGRSDEWYTPPNVFIRLGVTFDLDPCAPEWPRAHWIPAKRRISLPDDGLNAAWDGAVWLNPPYSQTHLWVRRLAVHGNGIALVFARTDTQWWHDLLPAADAVCFVKGRLNFLTRDGADQGNAGSPSALVAFGYSMVAALERARLGMVFRCPSEELAGQMTMWEAA